ncbi:MAG: hypothetical protein KBD26_03225 [Candidatus Pacebacteria bacterium]|nr:hypothetical protein [Candidatus Paceibacterota bacterium]MBP9772819.1 hypothetical protein [Candidatus Paceibacterota bacterium]
MYLPDFFVLYVIPVFVALCLMYVFTYDAVQKIKKLKLKYKLSEIADEEFMKYINLKLKFSKNPEWQHIDTEQRKICLDSLLTYLENGDVDGKVEDYWQRLIFFLDSRIGQEDYESYDMRIKKVLNLA